MFDFDPRDYDSREPERHGNTSNRGPLRALTVAIATTTGGNPSFSRASATTACGRSAVVPAAIARTQMSRCGIGTGVWERRRQLRAVSQ
jgi:hypothetical protein